MINIITKFLSLKLSVVLILIFFNALFCLQANSKILFQKFLQRDRLVSSFHSSRTPSQDTAEISNFISVHQIYIYFHVNSNDFYGTVFRIKLTSTKRNKTNCNSRVIKFLFRVERFGRLWYLDQTQTSNGHNIISYIDFIYRIIWYAFDNGLENPQILAYYMSLVNDAAQKSMLSVKKQSQRCSVSINQISSSILLLNKLFYSVNNSQISNLKKQYLQILKNEYFLFEYTRVINNIVEISNRQTSEIEEKYKKQYKNLFKIFQYLLKFQRPEQKITILEKMDQLLAKKRFKFMCDALVEGEDSLKRELKKIYRENESYQTLIMSMIKRVEQNRRQKEEEQSKK